MSVKLMSKAWEMDIPTGQKMLLLALCDHANDDGACYPSQDKLAIKCSMGARTVIAHIKWLEEHGIISRERRQSTQRRKSDLYQICLDNYTPAPANSAPANSAPANSAPANFSPEPANFAPSEPANFAPSYIEQPSVFNHQIEPSEIAGQLSLAAAPAEVVKNDSPKLAHVKTKQAYAVAYQERYGVLPITQNAKFNALVANLVKTVGAEEAPQLARFFVWHNGSFFVQRRHDFGLLVSCVQQIRTDWLRNEQMTANKAKQVENTQVNAESHKNALEILKAKGLA